ncbi:MAG: hypothetical protein ACYCV7_14195, partial [Acidimicrobiales bacterium]
MVAGLKLACDQGRERDELLAEVTAQWWGGDPVPAPLADWPADSLGGRLFTDPLFQSALGVPPLRSALVRDPATI